MRFVSILKWSPSQARNPKGSPIGGRFAGGGGAAKAPLALPAYVQPDQTPDGGHINSLTSPVPVTSSATHELGGGINESVIVEVGGREFVFKPIEGEHQLANHDSPLAEREVLASRLDDELGFDLVPPTMMGEVDGRRGSLQDFLTNADTFSHSDPQSIHPTDYGRMAVFDALLGNSDRHGGNGMVKDGKLYAIDHGYTMSTTTNILSLGSFAMDHMTDASLSEEYQQELADRIEAMDEAKVFEGSHLDSYEIAAYHERKEEVLKYLRAGTFLTRTKPGYYDLESIPSY